MGWMVGGTRSMLSRAALRCAELRRLEYFRELVDAFLYSLSSSVWALRSSSLEDSSELSMKKVSWAGWNWMAWSALGLLDAAR